MLSMAKVDFSLLTKNKVRMLTGHMRGVESRRMFELDELEARGEVIQITVPENLEVITSSFVQGFLGDTVAKSGTTTVERLYDFSLLPSTIREDFRLGIERLKLHLAAKSRPN